MPTKQTKRDWTSVREWTNLVVGAGALLVAIVSVWTTAQISGLEDYFRSEISRRNSDLNALADQGRRLNALADERERRLTDLQTTTEQVTASNLEAQGKLLSTQQELSRLGFEVVNAKQTIAGSESRLSSLAAQSAQQLSQIDLFRRQRFFERANLRSIWADFDRSDNKRNPNFNGEDAYQMIINWPVGQLDADLAPYLPDFLQNAKSTCAWIRGYRPNIPPQLPYPPGPHAKGKPVEGGVEMTQHDYNEFQTSMDAWNKRWSEVSAANDRALNDSQKVREYIWKAAGNCMCQALVTTKHSASDICPGYDKAPQSPPVLDGTRSNPLG